MHAIHHLENEQERSRWCRRLVHNSYMEREALPPETPIVDLPNYCQWLGLRVSDGARELKAARRTALLLWHPDRAQRVLDGTVSLREAYTAVPWAGESQLLQLVRTHTPTSGFTSLLNSR